MLMARRYVGEAIGTFILIFVGTGSVVVSDLYPGVFAAGNICLIFGLVVMSLVYSLGNVSGAHLNPAVTVGFWLTGNFKAKFILPYILSQLLGACSASFLLSLIFPLHKSMGETIPSAGVTNIQCFTIETVITFILMFVILSVFLGNKTKAYIGGIVIGGVITFLAMFAAPISGASMNPIRTLAPALVSLKFDSIWIYLTAPFLGTVLATLLYKLLYKMEEEEKRAHIEASKNTAGCSYHE